MSRPPKALRRFFSCRTPAALRQLRDAGDEGFTLIELVVVMVILPLVIGALFYAIFVTLQSEAGVSTKVSDSVASQLSSEFYVRDVQSATLVTLDASATTPTVCGTGTKLLVSLSWPSGSGSGTTVVSYWEEPSGSTTLLVRKACKTGSTRPSTTTSRNFSTHFSAAQVACVSGKVTCATTAASEWIPAQWVSLVTIAATQPKGQYHFNLTAAPRVSNTSGTVKGTPPGGGKVTPLPTLLLLGDHSTNRAISEDSSGASIKVNGTMVIETGGYIHQTSGSSLTATAIETTSTGTPSKICTTPHGQAKCTSVTPPVTQFVHITPLSNPLADLPDPPEEALGTATGCPHAPTSLQPGRYTCKIKPPPNATLTLGSGIYEFESTVTLKNATLTAMSGVFMYFPCSAVDTWASSCSESLSTAGTSAAVNVKAMRTGLYSGLWYWQSAGDTSPVAFNSPTTITATGIMYVPAAAVQLYGGPGSQAVGSIVAYVLDVHNGTFVITGV